MLKTLDGNRINQGKLVEYQNELGEMIGSQIKAAFAQNKEIFGIDITGDIAVSILPGLGKTGDLDVQCIIPTNHGPIDHVWTLHVDGPSDEAFLGKLYPHSADMSTLKKNSLEKLSETGNFETLKEDIVAIIRTQH